MTFGNWMWVGVIILATAIFWPLGAVLVVGTLIYCMRKDGDL
jgi:hypothetical protein